MLSMFYNVLADIKKQFDNLIGRIHSAIFYCILKRSAKEVVLSLYSLIYMFNIILFYLQLEFVCSDKHYATMKRKLWNKIPRLIRKMKVGATVEMVKVTAPNE